MFLLEQNNFNPTRGKSCSFRSGVKTRLFFYSASFIVALGLQAPRSLCFVRLFTPQLSKKPSTSGEGIFTENFIWQQQLDTLPHYIAVQEPTSTIPRFIEGAMSTTNKVLTFALDSVVKLFYSKGQCT